MFTDTDHTIEPGLSPDMIEATARAQVADTNRTHTLLMEELPGHTSALGLACHALVHVCNENCSAPPKSQVATFLSELDPFHLLATAIEAARAALDGEHPGWAAGWRAHLIEGIEQLSAAQACAP